MSENYTYEGTTYTFEDGVSEADKIARIQSYLKKNQEEPKPEEPKPEESEGVFKEIGEGIISGGIGIGQGIGETVASFYDLIADTNYASDVTKSGNDLRKYLGVDPTGFAGKTAEIVTQFAVPGLGAAAAVSKFSKAGKLVDRLTKASLKGKKTPSTTGARFALGAKQVAAAGAADALVATDGITTIGDFFEGGPTQTNQEIGLKGRQEAARRITNKLKLGIEGAAATVVVPQVLTGVAKGAEVTGADVVVRAPAKAITTFVDKNITSHLGNYLDDIETKSLFTKEGLVKENIKGKLTGQTIKRRDSVTGQALDFGEDVIAKVSGWFRYRGALPEQIAEARSLIPGVSEAAITKATKTLNSLEKNLDLGLKEYSKVVESVGDTNLLRTQMFDTIEEILTNPSFGKNATKNKTTLKQEYKEYFDALPNDQVKKYVSFALDDIVAMRNQVDGLSKEILKSDYLSMLDKIITKEGEESVGDTIRQVIQHNLNSYLRKRYKIYEDANYKPTKEAIEEGVRGFKADKESTIKELRRIAGENNKDITEYGLTRSGDDIVLEGMRVTDEQANLAVESFLRRFRPFKKNNQLIGSVGEYKLNTKLFEQTKNLKKYERELLGEIKSPREAFLGTVADLSEFKAVDKYFAKIRDLAKNDEGIGRLFRDTEGMTPLQLSGEKRMKRTIIGEDQTLKDSPWGTLTGYSVPDEIYDDLTRFLIGDTKAIGNMARAAYSGFLKGKGYVQYGKTVLSPITQIRNVTTASLFALAQGNIGRGASLGESVRLVGDDIFTNVPKDKVLKELEELKELGVIGTQTELREIQDLISQGLGYSDKFSNLNVRVGEKFGSKVTDSGLGRFLGSVNRKAQDLYQGGDNVWKIYNYKFEVNKLQNALRELSLEDKIKYLSRNSGVPIKEINPKIAERLLKEEAARIVRNTVPNYNMVPEIVKELRKLPTGNFIAFPSEIIRTGFNTIKKGLEEVSSDIPGVQRIGLRRLSGAAAAFAIVPETLSQIAYSVSGVTKEMMDAYQRSLAPPWEKNARLIPTGTDKDGNIKYVNYSYSNPYDLLERTVNGALNNYYNAKNLGLSTANSVTKAFDESLLEFVRPFTDEAILTGKIRDVIDPQSQAPILGNAERFLANIFGGRAGMTQTGARVYSKEDSEADKASKKFKHVIGGMLPSIIPLQVSKGTFEVSRFAEGFLNTLVRETPQMDRQGRVRELQDELIRAFTGVTENTADIPLGLKYKGFEFVESNKNASGIFNQIARQKNVTAEMLEDAYIKANEARYRVHNEFNTVINDMRETGLDDIKIRRIFRKADIYGVRDIIRGNFDAFEVSDQIKDQMRQNNTKSILDSLRPRFREIRREFENREFGAPTTEIKEDEQQSSILNNLIQTIIPKADASPTMSTPPVNVPPPSPASSVGEINPLLVPNPTTRATFGSR